MFYAATNLVKKTSPHTLIFLLVYLVCLFLIHTVGLLLTKGIPNSQYLMPLFSIPCSLAITSSAIISIHRVMQKRR